MILSLVLAAAVILAAPPPATVRRDLEFTDAVEYFVRDSDRTARPPEAFLSLLGLLGAPCYRCRDLAGRQLSEASRGDCRWLLWGRHSRDPEVRVRCNRILRELTRCADCWGGGICRVFRTDQPDGDGPCANCGQWAWSHFDMPRECGACGGAGFAWVKGAFD
jgi:hypothetical protein